MTELMKQKQYSPLSIAEMAISLYAANAGYLDDVDVDKVVGFESGLHASFRDNHEALMNQINDSGDYTDKIEAGLKQAVEEFKQTGTF